LKGISQWGNIMRNLLKFLKKTIDNTFVSKPDVINTIDSVRGHLCQRKIWKEGTAITCGACRGDGLDFIFSSREQLERTQELKEKQLRINAS